MSYSAPEIEYLNSQHLARIATVSKNGQPDVVPVTFEFDGQCFYVGSHSQEIFLKTSKYKSVRDGNRRVSLVVDDLESVDPWKPRGIKIIGTAEIVEHKGIFGPGKYLKITPRTSWSWGISGIKMDKGEWSHKTIHPA
jgi:pyridoxamine 5'-phosphate oxidase family protein